jgi:hypothetical protein
MAFLAFGNKKEAHADKKPIIDHQCSSSKDETPSSSPPRCNNGEDESCEDLPFYSLLIFQVAQRTDRTPSSSSHDLCNNGEAESPEDLPFIFSCVH